MNKPKMILFDYGQTLVNQIVFDPLKGTAAVLKEASNNPNDISAEEVQALSYDLSKDIRRYGEDFERNSFLEVHIHIFQNYIYEYFGIEFTKSPEEVEKIFESAADCGMFSVWYKGAIDKENKNIPKREHLEIKDWNELIEILK